MILNNIFVAQLLKDGRIRNSFNSMISNKDWILNLRQTILAYNFDPFVIGDQTEWSPVSRRFAYFSAFEKSDDIETAINLVVEIFNKSSVEKTDDNELRIYNDNAHTFPHPRLSPMTGLNDPLEGLWRYRDTTPATMHIFSILKGDNLISACYTTCGKSKNEQYMISNYSRIKKAYISFAKSEFDASCELNDAFYGYVNYNKKAVQDCVSVLKIVLGIKTYKHIRDFGKLNYAIFIAFETLLNLFYKWHRMSDEMEYRAIKIGSIPGFVPIVTTKNNGRSYKSISLPNDFYTLNEDVKMRLT